jgi:hypothetical protein
LKVRSFEKLSKAFKNHQKALRDCEKALKSQRNSGNLEKAFSDKKKSPSPREASIISLLFVFIIFNSISASLKLHKLLKTSSKPDKLKKASQLKLKLNKSHQKDQNFPFPA